MLKLVTGSLLSCCSLLCCADRVSACNGGCSCSSMAMSTPMKATPAMPDMPGMLGMPMAPQANAGSQYRTYSYEPAPMYYRSYGGARASGAADAGRKVRGEY